MEDADRMRGGEKKTVASSKKRQENSEDVVTTRHASFHQDLEQNARAQSDDASAPLAFVESVHG